MYAIFFAENIQRQIELLGPHGASWKLLISIQALALIPLTWIRRIRNFAPVVLVADTLVRFWVPKDADSRRHRFSHRVVCRIYRQ